MRLIPKTAALMWAESHHCLCTVDGFDRPCSPHFVNALISQPLTLITTLASGLLIRTSSSQVGDSVVPIHRFREKQKVAHHERDLSKTDQHWQSLHLPHTPDPHCHTRIFG